MRKLPIAVGIILFSTTSFIFIFSQDANAQNSLVRVSNIVKTAERIDIDQCKIPNLPGEINEIVSEIEQGSKLIWCSLNTYDAAIKGVYQIQVDGANREPLQVGCINSPSPIICLAIIPINSIVRLSSGMAHTVAVIETVAVPVVGTLLISAEVTVRPPVCNYLGVVYRKGQPLPASVVGALRNQQGMFTFETTIGELRTAGFRTEWQRVQFGLDSNGLNGYNYLLAWCEGK